ncbi:MAG: hypothetical protein K2Q06_15455, partial [Parvularculaceae bacterium]|nr:hypothetical protein [Parvularculaceae bacterium]
LSGTALANPLEVAEFRVAAALSLDTKWDGPVTGPKAATGRSIIFIAADLKNQGIAGAMAGVFKLARGESYSVVEFMMIAMEPSGPVLRFKHFRKDYSTWEGDGPPQTLRLIRAGEGFAEFTPTDPASNIVKLDYRLAKGSLTAAVTLRADDNPAKTETFSFVYRRR